MKKLFTILLILVCALLCACGEVLPAVETAEITRPSNEYELLKDEDGSYVGVSFMLPNGVYIWDSPVPSTLPFFVHFHNGFPRCAVEYCLGNNEWTFDMIDLEEKSLLYRHENESGKAYTARSIKFGYADNYLEGNTEEGTLTIKLNESGKADISYKRYLSNGLPSETFYFIHQNHTIDINVIPYADSDVLPDKTKYRSLSVAYSSVYTQNSNGELYGPLYQTQEEVASTEMIRISGIDTVYYSSVPIEDITSIIPKEKNENCLDTGRTPSGYHFCTYAGTPYTYYILIDEHHFAILDCYTYDGDISTYYSTFALTVRSMCYY